MLLEGEEDVQIESYGFMSSQTFMIIDHATRTCCYKILGDSKWVGLGWVPI